MVELTDKRLIPVILECLKDNLKYIEQAKKDLEGVDSLEFTLEEIFNALSNEEKNYTLFGMITQDWGSIINDEYQRQVADMQYAIAMNNNTKIIELAKELVEGSPLNDNWCLED